MSPSARNVDRECVPVSGTRRITYWCTQTANHTAAHAGQDVETPFRPSYTCQGSSDNPSIANTRTHDVTVPNHITVTLPARNVDCERVPVSGTRQMNYWRTQTASYTGARAGQDVETPSRPSCIDQVGTGSPSTNKTRTYDATVTTHVTVPLIASDVDCEGVPVTGTRRSTYWRPQTSNHTGAQAGQHVETPGRQACTRAQKTHAREMRQRRSMSQRVAPLGT